MNFNNLRKLRTAAGLSQRQLAKLAGINYTDISNLESGKFTHRGNYFNKREALAEALGVSPTELISDDFFNAWSLPSPVPEKVKHRGLLIEFVKLESEPFSKRFLLDLLTRLVHVPSDELSGKMVAVQKQAQEYLNVTRLI